MSVRVTEVLDYLTEPELLNWLRRNSKAKCDKITTEAMRVGTAVDLLVREDIQSGGYSLPENEPEIATCMKAWELFKKDYRGFVSTIKRMQPELEHGEVIGHPDFVIEEESRWGIVDVKTSRSIQPRYWTQAAKYMQLENHVHNRTKLGFLGILRLDKITGLYEYKEITKKEDILYELIVFDAYLTAYNHNLKNREIIRQQLEEEILNVS